MKYHYPSIFISYSHDSEEHRDRCYALKMQLKRDGCKCVIDRDQVSLKPRWPRWCEEQIEALDFVIVVCSKIYDERYKAKAAAGKGVTYQGYVITEDFYKKHSSDKEFIPVCFEKEDTAYIPAFLKGANCYVISQVDEYIKLLRKLFNTPEYFEVEQGPRPDLGQTPPPVLFEASAVKEMINSYDTQQSEPSIIELTLDRDLEECSPEDQKKLTMAIMTILSIADVNIVRKQNGSGKLAIELPTDKAEFLSKAVQAGLLNEHKVIKEEISYDIKEWYYQALESFGAQLYREKVSILPNLSQLYIGHRRLINLVGFPVLPKLKLLILYYNQLSSLEGFPLLPNLSELDLTRNQLSCLAGLPALPKLSRLNLNRNQFSRLEGFPDLPNLKRLSLCENKLSSLETLPALTNLSVLYLWTNQFSSLEGFPALPNLIELDLGVNQLNSIESLPALPKLSSLVLSFNQLSSLEDFPALPNLDTLYLSSNQFSSLEGFPLLPKLSVLCLRYNQLSTLKGLPDLSNLSKLDLSSNMLSSFKDFPTLPNLIELDLGSNQFNSLEGFPALLSLTELNLSSNQLSSLAGLPALPSLEELNLCDNKISSLEGFPNLANLKGLNLYGNQLSSLEGFPELANLNELDLRGNSLKEDDISFLKRKLPQCKIFFDDGTSEVQ